MTAIETKIKNCINPIISNLGYQLYDVIYEKEGRENYLRIFIDKADGISLNDCENVNNSITDILDEKDFIKSAYMLEVSSTGIEKRIREDEHLNQNIGNKIEVHTFKAIEKQKSLIGTLKEYNENSITLEIQPLKLASKKSKKQTNKRTTKNDKANSNKTNEEQTKTIEIEKSNIIKMTTVYDWGGK